MTEHYLVHGLGFNDDVYYTRYEDGSPTIQYNTWQWILRKVKHAPAVYSVEPHLLTFSNFVEWFDAQRGAGEYELAIDILEPHNKRYDRANMVFIPRLVSYFWKYGWKQRLIRPSFVDIDVYIAAKEKRGMELAAVYEGKLDDRVIHVLRNRVREHILTFPEYIKDRT